MPRAMNAVFIHLGIFRPFGILIEAYDLVLLAAVRRLHSEDLVTSVGHVDHNDARVDLGVALWNAAVKGFENA